MEAVISENSVLSDESVNGVAPLTGSSDQSPLIDDGCVWVCRHQSGWQFGEQGVIEAIVNHLDDRGLIAESDKWVVEFGAGDGSDMPVTVEPIARRSNWRSLFIEGNDAKAKMLSERFKTSKVLNEMVEIEGDKSIDALIEKSGIGGTPLVMVVDVDSTDYYIVKAMKCRPHVLCIETLDILSPVNGAAPFVPSVADCGKFVGDWFGTQIQANAAAMDELMSGRGYKLVFRSRVNSMYVREDTAELLRKKCVTVGNTKTIGHETATDPEKLDYDDNSVDEVYAPRVLDRLAPEKAASAIKEWVRVLKPRGILRISVPDMRKIIGDIKTDDPAINQDHVQSLVYGSGSKSGFVRESLMARMYEANVGSISDFASFAPDGSADAYSLNLMGVKRAYPKIENPRVCLVLSQPRFAFTGHEKALILLAQKLKFDIQESTGAFWDKDITLATMNAIAKYNPDYLLYSDYDSVFESSDVQKLLDTINNNPDIAAIGAIQPSRHHDEPLVLDKTLDYSGEITRVKFQHFGLTIIRREVFDELPQPWFWCVPGKDANGEWDWTSWQRSDADITFWRNLDLLGLRVYQHNQVNIGHITQCVKYVRDKGKGVQLVPIENYWKFGKPKDAIFNIECYLPKKPEPKGTT